MLKWSRLRTRSRAQAIFDSVTVLVLLRQIRMQAQGSLLQGSMMSNFINIYQTEGTRGLWRVSSCLLNPSLSFFSPIRAKPFHFFSATAPCGWRHSNSLGIFFFSCAVPQGVIPTAQRAAIVVGVELPVYDITKKHLLRSGLMGDTILTHFMSVSFDYFNLYLQIFHLNLALFDCLNSG